MQDNLANVTWQQATTKVYNLNTIVALVYHVNYFVRAILRVLQGGPLDAHDKYSFDHPRVSSENDWQKLLDQTWTDAEKAATLIEHMPESKLWEIFADEKYGNYYSNIQGVVEHTHYHLGQIVVIKKILSQKEQT
jgi:hypothetical protein